MYPVRLAPRLQAAGCEVLLVGCSGTATAEAFQKTGLPFFPLKPSLLNLFDIPRLTGLLRSKRVSLVHCHKSRDLRTVAPAVSMAGCNLVFTEHMGVRGRKSNPWHTWAYGKVDRVLSINEEVRRRNIGALPLPAQRICTLHYGVDLNEYCPKLDESGRRRLRHEFGAGDDETLVVLPGRLCRPKGQVEFIEAAAMTRERLPAARFLVVGGLSSERGADPGFADELRQMVDSSQLRDRVVFTDYRTDVPQILEVSDIVCVPSWDEAFGMVVIEAMALGAPVIGTASGGIPELIDDGRDGRLVKPKSAKALADAILDMAADPTALRKMGLQGRQKVAERFSMERHVTNLLAHYREVMASA